MYGSSGALRPGRLWHNVSPAANGTIQDLRILDGPVCFSPDGIRIGEPVTLPGMTESPAADSASTTPQGKISALGCHSPEGTQEILFVGQGSKQRILKLCLPRSRSRQCMEEQGSGRMTFLPQARPGQR